MKREASFIALVLQEGQGPAGAYSAGGYKE